MHRNRVAPPYTYIFYTQPSSRERFPSGFGFVRHTSVSCALVGLRCVVGGAISVCTLIQMCIMHSVYACTSHRIPYMPHRYMFVFKSTLWDFHPYLGRAMAFMCKQTANTTRSCQGFLLVHSLSFSLSLFFHVKIKWNIPVYLFVFIHNHFLLLLLLLLSALFTLLSIAFENIFKKNIIHKNTILWRCCRINQIYRLKQSKQVKWQKKIWKKIWIEKWENVRTMP